MVCLMIVLLHKSYDPGERTSRNEFLNTFYFAIKNKNFIGKKGKYLGLMNLDGLKVQ